MKFPKRLDTHIKESASWKILENKVPAEWVIREVSERDYGIDCYIELVNKDNEVTGDLLSGQLKGTKKIKWKAKGKEVREATFSGIKIETIHYWMNLPVPVFLLVADLIDSNLYFASVKQQVRSQYTKYLKQKSLSFTLTDIFQLGTELGSAVFMALYFKEKSHNEFVSNLRTLFVQWQHYLDFIQGYQHLDCFLVAEPDEELLFIHIYLTLHILSQQLALDWDIESLSDILKKDQETWKDSYYLLHYQTFTNVDIPV
ncbi:hypothetical protein ES703_113764 [subsurface metagenome]